MTNTGGVDDLRRGGTPIPVDLAICAGGERHNLDRAPGSAAHASTRSKRPSRPPTPNSRGAAASSSPAGTHCLRAGHDRGQSAIRSLPGLPGNTASEAHRILRGIRGQLRSAPRSGTRWVPGFSRSAGCSSSIAVLVVIGTSGTSITSAYSAGRFLGAGAVVFSRQRAVRRSGSTQTEEPRVPVDSEPLVDAPLSTGLSDCSNRQGVGRGAKKGSPRWSRTSSSNVVSGLLVSVLIVVVLPGAPRGDVVSGIHIEPADRTESQRRALHRDVSADAVGHGRREPSRATAVDGSGVSHALSITIVRGGGRPADREAAFGDPADCRLAVTFLGSLKVRPRIAVPFGVPRARCKRPQPLLRLVCAVICPT